MSIYSMAKQEAARSATAAPAAEPPPVAPPPVAPPPVAPAPAPPPATGGQPAGEIGATFSMPPIGGVGPQLGQALDSIGTYIPTEVMATVLGDPGRDSSSSR